MSTTTPDQAIEPAAAASSAPASRTRAFYWSLRRELWENRSIYMAPAIAAGVVLFGMLVGVLNLPSHIVLQGVDLNPNEQSKLVEAPFAVAALIIMVAASVTGFFYCLGALYGERRDRTILFWKSLPVSDLTTVAAKIAVPMVVLPIATYLVIIVTQLVLLVASVPILSAHGFPPMMFWQQFPLLRTWGLLAIVLACLSLWNAPVWGWAFLVSGWAKRVTFLWAVGPPIGLAVFEELAFHTHYVSQVIDDRVNGGLGRLLGAAGDVRGRNISIDLDHLDLARFFSSPSLWIGLVVAAVFFAAVVWQRRYRAPF